jgi:RHS repeat-associated protein
MRGIMSPCPTVESRHDLVGNITKVENATSAYTWQFASVRTGPKTMSYTYDNMYQLKSATGKYRPDLAYAYEYSSTFKYDEIGNLAKKSQVENRLVWDNPRTIPAGLAGLAGGRFDHTVSKYSYTLDYKYTGTRPHAASAITETSSSGSTSNHAYSYDSNGNNAGNTYQGTTRVLTWDEENRLKQVTESGVTLGKFLYSPDGERTQKQTAAGDSLYVNQFYAYQPNKVATKHIFAGETRIVSKSETYSDYPKILYYHPDHLGSTSYVTRTDETEPTQAMVQHERYFPFGERDFGEQEECDLSRPNGLRREWTFNSKELDVETGYHYFGARYYDPRTSVWMSPDPILASYMRGQVNAGVFAPRNLGLYTYTWNNPMTLRDPDGKTPWAIMDSIPRNFGPQLPAETQAVLDSSSNRAYAAIGPAVILGPAAGAAVGALTSSALVVGATELAVGGVAGGLAQQAYSDLESGQLSSAGTYAESGAIGGLASLATGGVLYLGGKVVGGLVSSAPSGVQANKVAGDAFRDEVAATLRTAGRDVRTEVPKETVFGPRVIDIEVSHKGKVLGGIEAKVGGSPYKPSQRAKDAYLKLIKDYPVNVIRKVPTPRGKD